MGGVNLFLPTRRQFLLENSFFVVVFGPETPFFGDETLSRRRF
ncbi:hypothetical protein B4166_1669 [Caldibacillus thermoamylovorans]|uniref:Uncharacterized protein n=1 Tax=Caldibacillus thermoamylovorans TaxID=35841 RepID=A0ABD4ABN0_9BACI|nr:hypothetical protein B4166_1669 [Caldibacillus thermoamylovorans]KIO74451.1 hypothetical protein B4167_1404 [Caldibacillus thermoamylovorans]